MNPVLDPKVIEEALKENEAQARAAFLNWIQEGNAPKGVDELRRPAAASRQIAVAAASPLSRNGGERNNGYRKAASL
jgi:hypothetical protein